VSGLISKISGLFNTSTFVNKAGERLHSNIALIRLIDIIRLENVWSVREEGIKEQRAALKEA
jgi:hypothetical protein